MDCGKCRTNAVRIEQGSHVRHWLVDVDNHAIQ